MRPAISSNAKGLARARSSGSSSSSSSSSNARRKLEEELAGPVKEITDADTFGALCPSKQCCHRDRRRVCGAQSKEAAEEQRLGLLRWRSNMDSSLLSSGRYLSRRPKRHICWACQAARGPGAFLRWWCSPAARVVVPSSWATSMNSRASFRLWAVKRGQRRTMGVKCCEKAIQAEDVTSLFPNAGKCQEVHDAAAGVALQRLPTKMMTLTWPTCLQIRAERA